MCMLSIICVGLLCVFYVTLFDIFIWSLWRCRELSWVISQLPHFMSCVVGTVTSDSDLGWLQ